ncbi:MAG TPA: alpha-ketoglutarate-dependent dioxygenase AlkB [Nevskiaceae bacterium]
MKPRRGLTATEAVDRARLCVRHAQGVVPSGEARRYLAMLGEEIAWRQYEIIVAGRRCLQPRLTAWYGDPGARYRYSGRSFDPRPWTPTLLELRRYVEDWSGRRFNAVLLNLYRNGRDAVGWHSDNEPELGPEPVIASLSLGATRCFEFREKSNRTGSRQLFRLMSGSVLIMAGTTQRFWQHRLRREPAVEGVRVNLSFRQIVPRETPCPVASAGTR